MKTIAFRIIPEKREWLVKPLVNGVVLDKPVSSHTSRSKAWDSIRRNFFKYHSGRKSFNLILEIEDEKLET